MSDADIEDDFINELKAELNEGRRQRKAAQADSPTDLGEWNVSRDPGQIPPRQWLLGNQFCRGFVSSLFAAGGVGKSALRLLQLMSLALGKPLCGQHVFRRCRVLLISLEDDHDELQRRIKAVLQHYKIERSDLEDYLWAATPLWMTKLAQSNGRFKQRSVGPLEAQIRDAVVRRKPDIVALDPFVKLHDLEENDSGDMNFVCSILILLAVEYGISVDVPHHVHKGMISAGDADAGRGSSGIRDAGRLIYTLTPMSEDEASMFNIAADERFSYIRLDSAKVNIAPRDGEATWFHLVGEPIGNGNDDYPNGDEIQVAEPWLPPELWAGLDYPTINRILDEIDVGVRDENGQPTGERYTHAGAATKRAAWLVVQRFATGKTEEQCRKMVREWVRNGVLIFEEYDSKAERKRAKGLRLNAAKRPGMETSA
jgi:hypothetical protein